MKERLCLVCGCPVQQASTGRPREYHDTCGDLERLLRRAENHVEALGFDVASIDSRQAASRLRSRLWSMANLLNSSAKLPVKASACR
jgi:hypothetical protein